MQLSPCRRDPDQPAACSGKALEEDPYGQIGGDKQIKRNPSKSLCMSWLPPERRGRLPKYPPDWTCSLCGAAHVNKISAPSSRDYLHQNQRRPGMSSVAKPSCPGNSGSHSCGRATGGLGALHHVWLCLLHLHVIACRGRREQVQHEAICEDPEGRQTLNWSCTRIHPLGMEWQFLWKEPGRKDTFAALLRIIGCHP